MNLQLEFHKSSIANVLHYLYIGVDVSRLSVDDDFRLWKMYRVLEFKTD